MNECKCVDNNNTRDGQLLRNIYQQLLRLSMKDILYSTQEYERTFDTIFNKNSVELHHSFLNIEMIDKEKKNITECIYHYCHRHH